MLIFCFLCTFAPEMEDNKILITGASGFVGSFVVEEALRRGMEVWAVVRKSSSLAYLLDNRIHIVYSDLSSVEQITEALQGLSFDYVAHVAGCTKALKRETFYKVNTDGTANLCTAIMRMNPSLKRFVYISSLSIFGPVRDAKPYTDILDSDTPMANTDYGKSKLAAEQWLKEHCLVPYTILRPTGVYGPREKDYMMMADSIRKHIDVASGWSRQDLTFVFVKDVVQAVFKSMKSDKTVAKAYFLSDGNVYDSRDFSELIKKELNKRYVLRLVLPLCVLRLICAVSDCVSQITGKLSTLNNDHYNVLAQRNWRCDIAPARQDFGYEPQYDLAKGVKEMLK